MLKNSTKARIITRLNLAKLPLSMKTKAHFLIVAFLVSLLSACGGGGDIFGLKDKTDYTAPVIAKIEPADLVNTKTLPPSTTQISVEFSESINGTEALASGGLTVEPKLPGSWVYDDSEYKLKFTFEKTAGDLPVDTTYKITLKTSIQDLEGNTLVSPKTIEFSTPQSYRVKGIINNLKGSLKLVDQDGVEQTVTGDGSAESIDFEFSTSLVPKSPYKIELIQFADTTGFCASNKLEGVVADNDPFITISCSDIQASKAEAANWNSYYSTVESGKNCSETETTLHCAHGGELRQFELPDSVNSCDGISVTDNQGAFNWVCSEEAGLVTVSSTGLADGKGLTDLIDFQRVSWKLMRLIIIENGNTTSIGDATAGLWWNNPIKVAGLGSTLDVAGAIYIIKESTGSNYLIKADGIALVTAPGVTQRVGFFTNRNAIEVAGASYTWIEGVYKNVGRNQNGLVIRSTDLFARLNVVNNFQMTYTAESLIWLSNAYVTTIKNTRVEDSTKYGIKIDNNPALKAVYDNATALFNVNEIFNVVTNTHVLDADEAGYFINGNFNKFTDIVASWNDGDGIRITGIHNILSDVASFNNLGHGLSLNSAQNNILLNIYTSSNDSAGIAFLSKSIGGGTTQATYNFISNLTSVNNFLQGVYFDAASDSDTNTLNNIVAAYNPDNCFEESPSGRCSDVTLVSAVDAPITETFIHDISGQQSIQQEERPALISQAWGEYEGGLSIKRKGACSYTPISSGICTLMDWRVPSMSASVLHSKNAIPADMAVHTRLSGTETNNSETTDNGEAYMPAPYLENAVEIVSDNVGNDNGLCENFEVCLYTPNLGAYQGDGELVEVPGFTPPVDNDNIILLQRADNGVVVTP